MYPPRKIMNSDLITVKWCTKGRIAPWKRHHGGHDGSKIASSAGAATQEAVLRKKGSSEEVPQGWATLVHMQWAKRYGEKTQEAGCRHVDTGTGSRHVM
jgi:hypothetical protein